MKTMYMSQLEHEMFRFMRIIVGMIQDVVVHHLLFLMLTAFLVPYVGLRWTAMIVSQI